VEAWQSELAAGRTQSAWDLLLERYRRLILATIRRLVPDDDDVMDVFASVCQALLANDCARLRRHSEHVARPASVATWLVAVVRNLTIDWLRRDAGRRRLSIPEHLAHLRREIYRLICLGGASYVEAYEVMRASSAIRISFHEFLREVRATQASAPCPQRPGPRGVLDAVPVDEAASTPALDSVELSELSRRLDAAMAALPDDLRVAINLFVVEGLAAEDVARVVGWRNGKAVYNRVYRALVALRVTFEREGIRLGDLA
jgi:RNA polymerase sigma factor (sigma-70 family)